MHSIDMLLMQWDAAKVELAKAKALESQLRNEVVRRLYPDVEADAEGTKNIDLGGGYKVKTVFKQSRRLNNKNGEVVEALEKIDKMGAGAKVIAERLVKWEPKLSKSEYDKLPVEIKNIIDKVITMRPATPTVELVKPKGVE